MENLDTAGTVRAKEKAVLHRLGRIVRGLLPGATVHLYGSAAKGVRDADSDLDVQKGTPGPP